MNLRKYSNSTTEYIYIIICKYVKDRLRQTHTTNRMRLQRYNPAQAMSSISHVFSLTGTKKGLQSHLTLKTLIKEGSYLLSHIALQYHRRKRA